MNGLKIQWFLNHSVGNNTAINLYTPFSGSTYAVIESARSNRRCFDSVSKSTTYFTARCIATDSGGTQTANFDIICIGY